MSKARKIFGVFFKAPNSMDEREVLAYAEYVRNEHPHWMRTLSEVIVSIDGEEVVLEYHFHDVPFERIRRITGYLVGSTERWNDAKKAELEDRKTHAL